MGELGDILAGLEPALGPLHGRPRPLGGGITNRNFRVRMGDEEYVVRRHGRNTELLGIDRDSERMALAEAARLGIAPALVADVEGGLVTRWIACEEPAPEELRERAGELARMLHGFHRCGLRLPSGFWVLDLLAQYARVLRARHARVPQEYEEAAALARRIALAVPLGSPAPCHNDLLPGNLIRDRESGRIMIVDWEYAGMGHPYFDLGNLSVNNGFDEAADDALLAAYHGLPPSDRRRAALKLMRMLSDAREAAWGVVQAAVSDLDFDFAAYSARHFARLRAAALSPDFEEWLAAA